MGRWVTDGYLDGKRVLRKSLDTRNQAVASTKLSDLDTWDSESGTLNVIIETPKGGRNKLKYDSVRGLFQLSKVLPRGTVFPFDFGSIPSTSAADGDPLDVLVLMEEPSFAGCLVPVRLIGVLEAKSI